MQKFLILDTCLSSVYTRYDVSLGGIAESKVDAVIVYAPGH